MLFDEEIEHLNIQQKEAVVHLGAPLLILAGPGSGKTRVITMKIAWLIKELREEPNSILAMTFTNKAAKEMKTRVHSFLQGESQDTQSYTTSPFISTFHSFGAFLLRRYHEQAGLDRNFQIYDSGDQLSLLKEANPQIPKTKLKSVLYCINRAKDHGLEYDASEDQLNNFIEDVALYRNYEKLKERTGNVDFGDLLLKPYFLIKTHESVKNQMRERKKWFFVDEYQDTNSLQAQWLYELCGNSANVVVVGDDDQSIYKFRGAVIENILSFEKFFPNVKKVYLEQNYRSTTQIVSFANTLIQNNQSRHKKSIFSERVEGALPHIIYFQYDYEEESYVVSQAQECVTQGEQLAVFYRVNAQSRGYEMALRRAKIDYEVVGAIEFFERAEIRDAIAFLRVFKNDKDLISFLRIANKPTRGLGKSTLDIIAGRMKQGEHWMDACLSLKSSFSTRAQKGIGAVMSVFREIEKHAGVQNEAQHIGDIARTLLEKSGVWSMYEQEDIDSDSDRISNLEEFISYASGFKNTEEDWVAFFEQLSLNEGNANTNSQNRVQLITLHRSKGLEFDRVIICGLEEDLIPLASQRDSDTVDIEEERRLLYVGITRAKNQLSLSCSYHRKKYGRIEQTYPSQFLTCFNADVAKWLKFSSVGDEQEEESAWSVGDRIAHEDYGLGYIRKVSHIKRHIAIHVEFDNEFEGTFIPKFSSQITKSV